VQIQPSARAGAPSRPQTFALVAEGAASTNQQSALYRTLRRWHFYAGLIVLPFVMILAFAGSLYLFKPQIDRLEERAFWRDLHAVTGFWVSGFALILLITALPWAGVWGQAFKAARTEFGWTKDRPDWKIGAAAQDSEHDHNAMMQMQAVGMPMTALGDIVTKAQREGLPFPVMVKPPAARARFGPPSMAWVVKSEAQNRPANKTITYDMATGRELTRKGFADGHPINKAISIGIAWHEGQLFGWINQLIGLVTALAIMTLTVSGFVMWRRRKSDEALGAPPLPHVPARIRGVVAIMLLLAALLPMLAASLILLWLVERLLLPRVPRVSAWLGLRRKPECP
jgi:uncharacterized iron-regulated membrane protein